MKKIIPLSTAKRPSPVQNRRYAGPADFAVFLNMWVFKHSEFATNQSHQNDPKGNKTNSKQHCENKNYPLNHIISQQLSQKLSFKSLFP